MSGRHKELGTPKNLSASGTLGGSGVTVIGFLCATSSSGTVKITAGEASGGADVTLAIPVSAGGFTRIPISPQPGGLYAVLTNCTGTFFL